MRPCVVLHLERDLARVALLIAGRSRKRTACGEHPRRKTPRPHHPNATTHPRFLSLLVLVVVLPSSCVRARTRMHERTPIAEPIPCHPPRPLPSHSNSLIHFINLPPYQYSNEAHAGNARKKHKKEKETKSCAMYIYNHCDGCWRVPLLRDHRHGVRELLSQSPLCTASRRSIYIISSMLCIHITICI